MSAEKIDKGVDIGIKISNFFNQPRNVRGLFLLGLITLAVWVIYINYNSGDKEALRQCEEKRDEQNRLFIEYVKIASKNEGILEAYNIIKKDSTK